MSYQLYRSMSLGESLQAALDELISEQHITPDLALKVLCHLSLCTHTHLLPPSILSLCPPQVLQQYDRSMSFALSSKVRTRYTFKGHLKVYRYCDNVWTCVLQNVEFKDSHANEVITSERVKIVACEASSSSK